MNEAMILIKKLLLAIFLTFILFLYSCAKEESELSSVPDRRVEININTRIDNNFDNPFTSKKYYSGTNGILYAGYGGVLIISNADASWLYAYDLCCPKEVPFINELKVMDNLIQAKCPKCGSVYNIGNGTGKVESKPSEEGLKKYAVFKDGIYFRVRN